MAANIPNIPGAGKPSVGSAGKTGKPLPPKKKSPSTTPQGNQVNSAPQDASNPKNQLQGNQMFGAEIAAANRGVQQPTQRPKKPNNLASKASKAYNAAKSLSDPSKALGKAKGAIPGLKGKKNDNGVGGAESNTKNLKKIGQKASRSAGSGGNGSTEKGSAKAGITNRAGRSVKNLGKERCNICGYQNGIDKDGVCKNCKKKGRTSADQVSKAEKAKNQATDLAAKGAIKAGSTFASGLTGGTVPPQAIEKFLKPLEGFVGKGIAAGSKLAGWQVKVLIVAPLALFLLIGFGVFIALTGGASGDLFEEREEEAAGTVEENTEDIQPDLTSAYIEIGNNYNIPWTILAGIGKSTTDHGTVSPYDDEERGRSFPEVSPAIIGTGYGPMLLTADSITDGGPASTPIGDVEIPNPNTLNLKFEGRPGKNGGTLQPVTAAASDFIEAAWPNNPIVSDWRPPDGFNEHNSGRALDIGCPTAGACTPDDVARLHTLAAWFLQNPQAFEVQHVIWEQRIHSGNGWSPMRSRGGPTADHYDHVHIFFKNSNQTSLGQLGSALPQSSIQEVSANTSNNPFNSGNPVEVPDDALPPPPAGDSGDETEETSEGEGGSQSYVREITRLAELIVEARRSVYRSDEEKYQDLGLSEEDLSLRPYRSEESIEFWNKVIQRLPIDFPSAKVSDTSGGGGSGSGNVALGEEKEAVVSQIVWATRWIESGNNYTESSGCYTGAYQFGWSTTNGCYDTWAGYGGFELPHEAPEDIQDAKMTEVVNGRFDEYQGDVRKIIQHHLCPAQAGNDSGICGTANPDMGTYWACAAVLMNALPGNENRYSFNWTYHPQGASGLASYKANCEARIARALQDPKLPDEARSGGGTTPTTTPAATGQSQQGSELTATTATAPAEETGETPTTTQPAKTGKEIWDGLAECESNQNWAMNSGNGFHGGLQFVKETWDAQNGTEFAEFPHEATREEQIKVAQRLLEQTNWAQWPACTEKLEYRTAEGDVEEIRAAALAYNPDDDEEINNTAPSTGGPVTPASFASYAVKWGGQYAGLDLGLNPVDGGNGNTNPGVPSDQTPSVRGFIWPSAGPVSSGHRSVNPDRTDHRGVDLAPSEGSPVYASKGGTVTTVFTTCTIGRRYDPCGGGFGNHIYIDHGNGELTIYAHLRVNSVKVSAGERVTIGQQIAEVGHTGDSTGPHLHFEIRVNGQDINPVPALPPLQ